MKTFLLSPLLLLFVFPLRAQLNYSTSCELRDGQAHGFINNYRQAFDVDGTQWFYFYDCEGRLLGSADEYEFEHVSRGVREELEQTKAPSNACYCEFHPEEAIKDPGQPAPGSGYPPQNKQYTTDCEMRDGKAYGYAVALRGNLTIDGNIYFYFYDASGNYVSTEKDYEFEYLSSGDREEIENVYAPRGACRCSLVVDEAVRQ